MKIQKMKSLELSDIQKTLSELYPQTAKNFNISLSQKLFSPFHIQLPEKILNSIKNFNEIVHNIYKFKFEKLKEGQIHLRCSTNYKLKNLSYQPSILSCLDFHIDSKNEQIKLIEANTNASGYLIGSLVFKLHQLDFNLWNEKLLMMFKGSQLFTSDELYIADEHPEKQKMYLEFLLYHEFLKQNGKDSKIIDIQELNQFLEERKETSTSVGIYNRSTDFYLDQTEYLQKNYFEEKIKISPHPIAYDLFAHKDNLYEWSNYSELNSKLSPSLTSEEINTLQSFILKSQPMQSLFPDVSTAWGLKKQYFIKPSDSYGGKATYRGSSISKKYFESAWDKNYLAQEYFPAPKFKTEDNEEWKFDLRVYVYESEVLFSLARVYQGQITNFSTLGGGFAPVTFY